MDFRQSKDLPSQKALDETVSYTKEQRDNAIKRVIEKHNRAIDKLEVVLKEVRDEIMRRTHEIERLENLLK